MEVALKMNAIKMAETIIRKYPQLSYKVEDLKIRVETPAENGFSVELIVKSGRCEVIYAAGFAKFSLDFENFYSDKYTAEAIALYQAASALREFVWGLTDQCRLKSILYGESEHWVSLQVRTNKGWKTIGLTGSLLFPSFWKTKKTSYFQNDVINDLSDTGREYDREYYESIAATLLADETGDENDTPSDCADVDLYNWYPIRHHPKLASVDRLLKLANYSEARGDRDDADTHRQLAMIALEEIVDSNPIVLEKLAKLEEDLRFAVYVRHRSLLVALGRQDEIISLYNFRRAIDASYT